MLFIVLGLWVKHMILLPDLASYKSPTPSPPVTITGIASSLPTHMALAMRCACALASIPLINRASRACFCTGDVSFGSMCIARIAGGGACMG